MIGTLGKKRPYRPFGLVSEWRFVEIPPGARGTLRDRASGGNPGTIWGRPALNFDAVERAEIASGQFNPTGTRRYFHFAGRFNMDAAAAVRCLLDIEFWGGAGGAQWVNISAAADDTVLVTVRGASTDITARTASGDALAEGSWTDLAVEIDSTDDVVTVAIDGVVTNENVALSGVISGFAGATMDQAIFGFTDAGADQYAGKMNYLGFGWDDSAWVAADYELFHDFPATFLGAKFGSGDAEYWLCDEGTGITAAGAGGVGLALFGPDWDMGANGGLAFSAGAMTFDATDDYVNVADAANLRFSAGGGNDNPFSVAVWASPGLTASNQSLISKYDSSSLREWFLRILSTEVMQFRLSQYDDGGDFIQVATDGDVADGNLHHFVGTYDGGNAHTGLIVYVDGVAVAQTQSVSSSYPGLNPGAAPVLLGSYKTAGTPGAFLNGTMVQAQIYNRELTALEVKALYKQGAYR